MNDLPEPNEAIILQDGTRIDPQTGQRARPRLAIAVPSQTDAQRIVTQTRRKLSDLPTTPKAANALMVVLGYTHVGLNDDDIAIATGLATEQVARMRTLPAYKELERTTVAAIIQRDSDDVRTFISQHARGAAQSLVEATQSEDPAVALRASMDVLDRAGHRPADVVEHRVRMEGALTIEFIEKDAGKEVPTITIDKE
jgi:hypothetical protein